MNDLSKGILDERLGTHSGASGDTTLIMDIAEPTLVTIEIKGQFSLDRTGRAEFSQGNSISTLTFSSDGKKLISDSLTCPSSQLSCIRDVTLKSELIEVTPGQKIRVGVSGSGKIFPQIASGNESYSGTFTYTVRVIEETGCRGLTLDVFTSSPGAAWPTMPSNNPQASHDNTAAVIPLITDPAPSGGCVVDFDVEPVSSKGHVHGVHQRDKAGTIEVGGKAATSCIIPEGMITCNSAVLYRAPQISGEEKINATLKDTEERASKSIFIMVPALSPLFETEFYRVPLNRDTSHPENHYATNDTISAIQGMAQDYFEATEGTMISINDMSLPWGGLFDISGNWAPSHHWHRTGKSVDIDHEGVDETVLDEIAITHGGRRREVDRIHYEFP